MLLVEVKGAPKNLSKKETWDLLSFISEEMKLNRYHKPNPLVTLVFRKGFSKKHWYLGWCGYLDSPRECFIEVDKDLKKDLMIETIIHEFVHVRQFVSKLWTTDNGMRWIRKKGYSMELPHHKRPWERDAFRVEKLLTKKYKKLCERDDRLNKKKEKRMSKTAKLLRALNEGAELSTAQIRSRYGFESDSAVTSVIRNLRSQGHSVYSNVVSSGVTKYRIGKPRRTAVATAYAILGSEIFR